MFWSLEFISMIPNYKCASCKNFRPLSETESADAIGECRGSSPTMTDAGGMAKWPLVAASESGCARFNPFSASAGRMPKIRNEVILNTIFQENRPHMLESGLNTAPFPRAELINRMIAAGMSATPALSRLKTMQRRGLIEMGNLISKFDKSRRPVLSVWPVPVDAPVDTGKESDDIVWLRMIESLAPESSPRSLRYLWRETSERTRESLTTAARRLRNLMAAGYVAGTEGAYWVKSVPPKSETAPTKDIDPRDAAVGWYNPYWKEELLPDYEPGVGKGGWRKKKAGVAPATPDEMTLD